jgi:hypothetical protein
MRRFLLDNGMELLILLVGIIAVLFLLGGCTALTKQVYPAYWIPNVYQAHSVPATFVYSAFIDDACKSSTSVACYRPDMNVIFIKAGLPPAEEKCVVNHEQAHAAGWGHGEGAMVENRCGYGLALLEDKKK